MCYVVSFNVVLCVLCLTIFVKTSTSFEFLFFEKCGSRFSISLLLELKRKNAQKLQISKFLNDSQRLSKSQMLIMIDSCDKAHSQGTSFRFF